MRTSKLVVAVMIAAAMLLITSQVLAAPQSIEAKKTPGVVATQKAEENSAKLEKQENESKENYKGVITAIDESSLTISLKDETEVTFMLTEETVYKLPKAKDDNFSYLIPGMKVLVKALRAEDDSLTAKKVILVPGKPTFVHHVGVVTDYQPEVSITIEAKDGLLYTFLLTADTKILPKDHMEELGIGMLVTIIAPRDVTSLDWTATGIVIHMDDDMYDDMDEDEDEDMDEDEHDEDDDEDDHMDDDFDDDMDEEEDD